MKVQRKSAIGFFYVILQTLDCRGTDLATSQQGVRFKLDGALEIV